jgi:hypothetical protein
MLVSGKRLLRGEERWIYVGGPFSNCLWGAASCIIAGGPRPLQHQQEEPLQRTSSPSQHCSLLPHLGAIPVVDFFLSSAPASSRGMCLPFFFLVLLNVPCTHLWIYEFFLQNLFRWMEVGCTVHCFQMNTSMVSTNSRTSF